MQKKKFINETFGTELTVLLFEYNPKECQKVEDLLTKKGADSSVIRENIKSANAFCVNYAYEPFIVIDITEFKKKSKIEQLTIIQHECGHFRQAVLQDICENVTVTDSEVYLRISDWAFRKVMSMKYFKKLLK